ncbi:MAG: pyridoxamine 5'-phosphate oxidase family protein [Dehalococcoidia bacterium]|nr:pyridoxamine 5'-phosphate oxidase family protein [Dehalococcoidia bacterium]
MPRLTNAERDAFLQEPGILCRIATIREDGAPYVTPAWFIEREGRIYITPRSRSAWLGHIRREPRVSITIDEEAHPYRKVRLDGRANIDYDVGVDDQWRDLYRDIAKRYVPPEGAERYIQETIDQPRALLSIGLDEAKVTTWRMPVQGESFAGIWHDRYYDEGTKLKGQQ